MLNIRQGVEDTFRGAIKINFLMHFHMLTCNYKILLDD